MSLTSASAPWHEYDQPCVTRMRRKKTKTQWMKGACELQHVLRRVTSERKRATYQATKFSWRARAFSSLACTCSAIDRAAAAYRSGVAGAARETTRREQPNLLANARWDHLSGSAARSRAISARSASVRIRCPLAFLGTPSVSATLPFTTLGVWFTVTVLSWRMGRKETHRNMVSWWV